LSEESRFPTLAIHKSEAFYKLLILNLKIMKAQAENNQISINSESKSLTKQLTPLDTDALYTTHGGSILPSAPEIYDSIVDFVKRGIKALY
jgi:hypothetical protein